MHDFKKRLLAGEALIGTWMKTPAYIVAEVLAKTNLDVVCLDAEHAPFDRIAVDSCIHALRSGDMPALVRTSSAAPEHILSALDCGALGVVIPHVSSASKASAIVKSAHFGAGGRGYAGSTRAASYTTQSMSENLRIGRQETCVIAQIEDIEALDEIDAIADVDGIDCLFIGRIDLTVAMGVDSPENQKVIDAVARICKAGRDHNCRVGMFVADSTEIPEWLAKGANLFLLGSDHGFMLKGAHDLVDQFNTYKR